MEDQILVNIYLPAAGKSFEVNIPENVRMGDVQNVIAEMLADLSDGMFMPMEPNLLINKSSGQIININATAAQQHIMYGAQLLLI